MAVWLQGRMLIMEENKSQKNEVISEEMKETYRQISRTIITTPNPPPQMENGMDPQRIAVAANHSPVPERQLNRDGISEARIR